MGILTDILKGLPLSALLEEKLKTLENKFETIENENEQLRSALDAMSKENVELKGQLSSRSISQATRAKYSEEDLLNIVGMHLTPVGTICSVPWYGGLPHKFA